MSYAKVVELQNQLRDKYWTQKLKDYIQNAMDGELGIGDVIMANFVGTERQIAAEKARRTEIATNLFNSDKAAYQEHVVKPIVDEIYQLTIDQTPTILINAIPKLYSMAYAESHSAGYAEVYNTYGALVDDIEEVVKLLNQSR